MIKAVIDFCKESYRLSPLAFYCEMVETTVLIAASAILTFTVLDPATHIFIPLYLLGSMLAVFSTYRRGSSALLLTLWFTAMNSVALVQLIIAGVYW